MFDDKKRKRKTQHPTGMEENLRRKEFGYFTLAQHFNTGLSVGAIEDYFVVHESIVFVYEERHFHWFFK